MLNIQNIFILKIWGKWIILSPLLIYAGFEFILQLYLHLPTHTLNNYPHFQFHGLSKQIISAFLAEVLSFYLLTLVNPHPSLTPSILLEPILLVLHYAFLFAPVKGR